MNLSDCINIIKNCTTLACEYHVKNKCEYGYEVRENRFNCAKEQAIKALEKQIPKKPHLAQNGLLDLKMWYCPECDTTVISDWNKNLKIPYCHSCGQKLDWETDF